MSDGDPRDEIARLEAEIEAQSESIERCRKIILISKLIAAGGALVIVLLLIGIVRFDAAAMIGSMAAVLGSVVMFGSTASTSQQLTAARSAAEARRADLIGTLDLHVVADGVERYRLN
jgi:hypothetical protein